MRNVARERIWSRFLWLAEERERVCLFLAEERVVSGPKQSLSALQSPINNWFQKCWMKSKHGQNSLSYNVRVCIFDLLHNSLVFETAMRCLEVAISCSVCNLRRLLIAFPGSNCCATNINHCYFYSNNGIRVAAKKVRKPSNQANERSEKKSVKIFGQLWFVWKSCTFFFSLSLSGLCNDSWFTRSRRPNRTSRARRKR